MKDKMAEILYEVISTKKTPESTDTIHKSYVEWYISALGLEGVWNRSGLGEEQFDKWFDMYVEPFRFLNYKSCIKLLSYYYDVEKFDNQVIELADNEKRSNDVVLKELNNYMFSILKDFCADSVYLRDRNYVRTILKSVKRIIDK